jgi:AcrR family transcriptional regulator
MSLSTNSAHASSLPPAVAAAGVAGVAVASGVRERILTVAYELFARRGVRDVGVNELISRSGVAKASFYRHFASKDELVLAFLPLAGPASWPVG